MKANAKQAPIKKLITSKSSISFMGTIVSIIMGLLLGLILLLIFNAPFAFTGMNRILTQGFSTPADIATWFYQTAPLICVGLSVGFASKTGLFNIGAPGQYTVGACLGLISCVQFQNPWYVSIVVAAIGGAIWGVFPGLFKALFNVNEVITSIMFNWIAVFGVNLTLSNMPMMLSTSWGGQNKEKTPELIGQVKNLEGVVPNGIIGKILNPQELASIKEANIGIIVAIVIAVIIYVLLNKTTFGYELKACGLSQNAGIYAGIKAKRNMVLSMVIAGALAGIGGGIFYLSGVEQFTIAKKVLGMGFNGIPVALLAYNNPIGIIFSALFIALIKVGGAMLQPDFSGEIVDIITAAIIYFSAFSLLVQSIIKKFLKADEGNVNAEPVKTVASTNDNLDNKTTAQTDVQKSDKEVSK